MRRRTRRLPKYRRRSNLNWKFNGKYYSCGYRFPLHYYLFINARVIIFNEKTIILTSILTECVRVTNTWRSLSRLSLFFSPRRNSFRMPNVRSNSMPHSCCRHRMDSSSCAVCDEKKAQKIFRMLTSDNVMCKCRVYFSYSCNNVK